ncbi:MAG TPA: PEGA domain-containing protein [Vicinamibacterales bacterium]|nr:PEGA domain-containing protein [Vicinamibacterales bacterium]
MGVAGLVLVLFIFGAVGFFRRSRETGARAESPDRSAAVAMQVASPGRALTIPESPRSDIAKSSAEAAVTAPRPPAPSIPTPSTSSRARPRAASAAPERSRSASASIPPIFKGHLIVDSEPPGATVLVNQRPVGVTPLDLGPHPTGSYAVWVQHEGYERWTAGVLVPASKVTRVKAELRKAR